MLKIFILNLLTYLALMGQTFSVAGLDSEKNMTSLMEETGIKVFQMDLPWRDYHLSSELSGGEVINEFSSLEDLRETLDMIRRIDARVIIQLSVHYVPQWFMDNHRDKLLRNYRGSFEIQSEDREKHIVPSPFSNLVKYRMIGAWYDFMGRFLSENYSDIIEYINPGILEEGQMSYPWAGYDTEELVFWIFDKYAREAYRDYLNRIFSLNREDSERSYEKLERINEKYGTNFFDWSEVRPPQTYEEIRYYKVSQRGNIPYFYEFLEFYAEGPLSIAKLYSDILLQYFPKEKLAIKIPHWHRGGSNKRTFAEGRFINYYIRDLEENYGAIIFLPIQDTPYLSTYIKNAKRQGFKVILEPTIGIGDWKEVDSMIESLTIDGINAVNISNFLGEENEIYREVYRDWIKNMKK